MVFLNASLNFCFYFLVSKRYRNLLKETFYCFLLKFKNYNSWLASITSGFLLRLKMPNKLFSSSHCSRSASTSNLPLSVSLIFVNSCTIAYSEEHPMLERREFILPTKIFVNKKFYTL